MRQDNKSSGEESVFQDEACSKHIEKITRLERLIAIEEKKLFEAMRNVKNNAIIVSIPHR
jgi:hypothetical protein